MKPRTQTVLVSLGAAFAAAGAGVYLFTGAAVAVPSLLLINIIAFAALGTLIIIAKREQHGIWIAWVPWIVYGALLAAILAGPLVLAPWTLGAALAFGAAGLIAGLGGWRGLAGRFVITVAAALLNFGFLWPRLVSGPVQISQAEFIEKGFHVNSVLTDVPLHDVWVFRLRGGDEGLSLADVRRLIGESSPANTNTLVAGLVGARILLGELLDLDDERYFDEDASFVHRLTEEERQGSLEEPGTRRELFRTLYAFENEAVAEMMNRTAHAFFCMALEPADSGYNMYWAIYVKETGPQTPIYMALIDPFRRRFVYPAMVSTVERAWSRRWGGADPPTYANDASVRP